MVSSAKRPEPPAQAEDSDAAPPPARAKQLTEFGERLAEVYGDDPEAFERLHEAFRVVTARPRRDQLLHESLLTMLVGALESTVTGIGAQHFILHPGALPGEEKEFSLADLADFENLEDARDLAITRRVDELVRGGLEAWNSWLRPLLKIELADLAADYEVLYEVVQRRHIVVHNAGRVSRRYVAKVGGAKEDLGEKLVVERSYLESAIREVTIFGARLLLVAWSRWVPGERDAAAEKANALVFQELIAKRYDVARCIARTAREIADEDQMRLFLQVNEWIARRGMFGSEDVYEEVEAWDISALSPLYAAARSALLGDISSLALLLPQLVEHGEMSVESLRSWPLFENARETQEWPDIVEAAEAVDRQQ